jgi:hypothetical protein
MRQSIILFFVAVAFLLPAGAQSRETKQLQVTLAPTPKFIPRHTGSGDFDFDGNGPEVRSVIKLEIRNERELWLSVYLNARESKKDYTSVEGSMEYKVCAFSGRIVNILSTASTIHQYRDSNHEEDSYTLPQGELVATIVYVGDTDGNEAGTRTGLTVTFQPVILLVEKDAQPLPSSLLWQIPFAKAAFRSSHNSYSGDEVGTIADQLHSGVRGIELDFHDNDIEQVHDFQVGHGWAGHEVCHEGTNPESDRLGDWLRCIRDWSDHHPGHSPITVFLDIKDDLTDNPIAYGYHFLDAKVREAFAPKLLTPAEYDGQKTVAELHDRLLVVLSGDEKTKREYKAKLANGRSCFIDGGRERSEILSEADVVNLDFSELADNDDLRAWALQQVQNNRIVRFYNYNPDWLNREPKTIWPAAVCNFPSTDHPSATWYQNDFAYVPHYLTTVCCTSPAAEQK